MLRAFMALIFVWIILTNGCFFVIILLVED